MFSKQLQCSEAYTGLQFAGVRPGHGLLEMSLLRIPLGLVPRGTTLQCCVQIGVWTTLLGRLLLLGTLLFSNNNIYTKLFTPLNSESSDQDISQCEGVTMVDMSKEHKDVSLYEK